MTERHDLVRDLHALLADASLVTGELRLGVDVCSIAELDQQLSSSGGPSFRNRVFTPHEIDYAAGRTDRLATRWAAKEAVGKAIGTGFRDIEPRQIEIHHDDHTGQPSVRPSDDRPWPHNAHRWRWAVSLSHQGDAAIAIAVGQPHPERPTGANL